ncbi:hypothetical protein ACU4GD_35590 [Cupriavidus basilensis]
MSGLIIRLKSPSPICSAAILLYGTRCSKPPQARDHGAQLDMAVFASYEPGGALVAREGFRPSADGQPAPTCMRAATHGAAGARRPPAARR